MGSKTPAGRRRWWIVSVVGLAVLGLVGVGLYELVLAPSGTDAATTTRTVAASRQTEQSAVGTTGTLEPARRADLSFSSSGTVTAVDVQVGDTVRKGDVLARIDDASIQADVDAARAELDAANSSLSDLESSGTATETALSAARAQVKLKQSALSQAESALHDATLRATFSGTVAAVGFAKGDQVGSGGSGNSGASGASGGSGTSGTSGSNAVITVISTNSYVVDTSVDAADLAKVKPGLQAVITPTGATDPIFGTVAAVGVMASSSGSASGSGTTTATFPVTIDVTEAQKNLFAGASATVSIIVEQRSGVLVVPTAAITTSNGHAVVQKMVGGSPVQTTVTVGSTYGNQTEITAGLSDGDQVQVSFTRPAGTGTRASAGAGQRQGGAGFGQGGTGQGGTGQGGTGQGGTR